MKLRREQQPRSAEPQAAISIDRYHGDHELRGAIEALVAGSWREVDKLLDVRGHSITGALLWDEIPTDVVEAWARTEPSARSLSALGGIYVRDAWAIRSSRRASDVDPSSWRGFLSKLEQAETLLRWTAATWRTAPDPWPHLITTSRGLEMGLPEMRARFAHLHERAPFHPYGCASMLQGLCKKWAGSHEAMFEFARWIDQYAPADSPAREALPVAHIEFLLSDDDLQPRTYFSAPNVAQELAGAAERYLAALASETPPSSFIVLNAYVIGVVPVDARSARIADELFRRIGDRVTEFPWHRWDADVAGIFHRTREDRLALARRFL